MKYNSQLKYGSTLVYDSVPTDIQKYWDYLNNNTTLANRTKKNYANAIYQLFNLAFQELALEIEEYKFGSFDSIGIIDKLISINVFKKPIYIGRRKVESYNDMNKFFNNNYSAAIKVYKDFVLSKNLQLPNVYAIRTKEIDSVASIKKSNETFTIGGIYNYTEELKKDDVIFLVLGGDNPEWNTGFKSIGKISKEPFDIGYKTTNRFEYFRIQITNQIVFENVFIREDFYKFPDTINAPFIGPTTKGEANQAIRKLENTHVLGIICGIIDRDARYYDYLTNLFSEKLVQYALDNSIKLIEKNNKIKRKVKNYPIKELDFINNWEQVIYYGAPGTGKSYRMKGEYPDFKRVTFHPEYSYMDFIGGLRPVQKETISYEFVSGPLTDIIIEALENPDKKIGLIIEEINRGNTSAIFGDTFQLLDRDNSGWSEFGIINKEMLDYFKKLNITVDEVKFPPNLSIVATMNNADQNIYVMDSAFKRRWERDYMAIDFENANLQGEEISGIDVTWGEFGTILNNHLSSIGVEEDKLIGQYFLTKDELKSKEKFSSKLLIYLWDDVVRYNRSEIFSETNNFSKLLAKFNENGTDIFVKPLKDELEGV